MADEERQGPQQGLIPSGSRHPHLPFQTSGSRTRRRRAGLSLSVGSAPFSFSLLALPGTVPSCGVMMPSAAHGTLGQTCSTGFRVTGLSCQQRAEHCSLSQLSQV